MTPDTSHHSSRFRLLLVRLFNRRHDTPCPLDDHALRDIGLTRIEVAYELSLKEPPSE